MGSTATPNEASTLESESAADDYPHGEVAADNEALTDEKSLITIDADGKKVRKIIKKKKRPARTQADAALFKSEPPKQTGITFNIWYNKWSGGDREDKFSSQTAAPGRCNIAKDSGFTRADGITGSFFCLFFARGLCWKGRDCEYLHRLPNTFDLYSGNEDCFGRDKHSAYRDDMGGVGSFMRQNRTLYVGRIHPTDDVEEIVARHFQEWGKIERARVLPQKGVAFVTYTTEALAQFAKEAMAHQSLDNNEILNVRWATQDPNPQAQKREARLVEEQAAEAIRRALPASFVQEIEGRDPEAKRRRKEEGTFGLEGYAANDDVWFQAEKAKVDIERAQEHALPNGTMERGLIEAPPDMDAIATTPQAEGLLSVTTLAALNSYRRTTNLGSVAKKAISNGPLVNYGSDSDEDD